MEQRIIVPTPRIIVPKHLKGNLLASGVWEVDHMRGGRLLHRQRQKNIIVTQGLNHLLEVLLRGTTQVSPWYMGIFEGNYTPVAGATAASITADSTESTAYDEATRVEYVDAAAVAGSVTNAASRATFTMNATKIIYGAFLASASAKSATTGTLFSATRFATARSVIDNDVLLITYVVTATSA